MLTALAFMLASGLIAALVYGVFRGRMTMEDAMKYALAIFVVVVIPITAQINGIAKEDAAAKTAGPVAAGGDVTVNNATPEVKS